MLWIAIFMCWCYINLLDNMVVLTSLLIVLLLLNFYVLQYGFIAWLLSTSVGLLLSFLRYVSMILYMFYAYYTILC